MRAAYLLIEIGYFSRFLCFRDFSLTADSLDHLPDGPTEISASVTLRMAQYGAEKLGRYPRTPLSKHYRPNKNSDSRKHSSGGLRNRRYLQQTRVFKESISNASISL